MSSDFNIVILALPVEEIVVPGILENLEVSSLTQRVDQLSHTNLKLEPCESINSIFVAQKDQKGEAIITKVLHLLWTNSLSLFLL